jgi:hypothetical protein
MHGESMRPVTPLVFAFDDEERGENALRQQVQSLPPWETALLLFLFPAPAYQTMGHPVLG